MKKRALVFLQEHRELVKTGAVFAVVGLAYYIILQILPVGIPCMIHLFTGLYCPGCGISRFFLALAQLRLWEAATQNLAIAVLLPVWLIIGAVEFWFNPKALDRGKALPQVLLIGSAVILIVFGILRNIPYFSWLQPGGLLQ